MDGAPVLAITGQTYHDLMGMHYQQEVNLLQLFSDVAVFNQQVMGPAHAHALVDAACRAALAAQGRRAHQLLQRLAGASTSDEAPSPMNVKGHTSKAWTPPIVVPQAGVARERRGAAQRRARRPSSSPARGRWGPATSSSRSPTSWARRSSRRCWARRSSPTTRPYTTGGLGLLGTLPSEKAMEECDTPAASPGSSFPYMQYLPEPGQAKAVQIDRDPTRLGLRYPIDIGLTGDAQATLQALLPLLKRRQDRSFLEKAQERMKEWWELMRDREERDDVPLKPQVVARHVNDLLADDAIVTTDSGTITTWAARHIKIRRGMKFSCSGNLATMAPGLPYANGAQVAFPDRQVVAFVGDGGFTMLMMEFITAVKHKLPIKVDHHQEQHARADQVGADGLPGQPRVRRRAPADRLRQVRRGVRRGRLPLREARRGPARRWRRRSRRRGRRWSRRSSTRSSRRMPAAGDVQAGAAHGRVAGPGRAAPRQDRH